MAEIIDVSVNEHSFTAMRGSVSSLCEAVAKLVGEGVEFGFSRSELADRLHDFDGLVSVETVATGAGMAEMKIVPCEKYLALTSAVAVDGFVNLVSISHGWPILSLAGGTPTIAEAGGAATAPGGGLAA